jgi:hypothetical protein
MPVVLSPLLLVRLLLCELSRLRLSEPLLLVESPARRLSGRERLSSLRRPQLRPLPLLPLELLVLELLPRLELLEESLPRFRDDPLELLLRLELLLLEPRLELLLELLLPRLELPLELLELLPLPRRPCATAINDAIKIRLSRRAKERDFRKN